MFYQASLSTPRTWSRHQDEIDGQACQIQRGQTSGTLHDCRVRSITTPGLSTCPTMIRQKSWTSASWPTWAKRATPTRSSNHLRKSSSLSFIQSLQVPELPTLLKESHWVQKKSFPTRAPFKDIRGESRGSPSSCLPFCSSWPLSAS